MHIYPIYGPLLARLFMIVLPVLVLPACVLLGNQPSQVGKTITIDEKGRKVTVYRICEQKRLPLSLSSRARCKTEKIVHNYCYGSIGKIDCYENPIPGRKQVEIPDG